MKKFAVTLVSVILIVFNSFCQSKYFIGLMVSPDFTYINGSFGHNIGATYTTKPGYTLGLSIYKKLSKHFFITSGLWYIDKGTITYTNFIYVDSTWANIIAECQGRTIHRYQDLDFPLIINYTLGKTKLKFVCSTGLVFGFALKETMTSITAYQTNVYNIKESHRGPDRINLNFSIGASYKINDTYSLLFEPNYKIDLRAIANTIWDDSHSFGLRTTLIYKFKN